jgi:hypothetical protein
MAEGTAEDRVQRTRSWGRWIGAAWSLAMAGCWLERGGTLEVGLRGGGDALGTATTGGAAPGNGSPGGGATGGQGGTSAIATVVTAGGGCVPACDGKQCGDDGCGASCPPGCGANETCQAGQCACSTVSCLGTCCASGQACFANACCTPACAGKQCGDDGCGASCADCPPGNVCTGSGQCICKPFCPPGSCDADDGCGSLCECPPTKICVAGTCENPPIGVGGGPP